MKFRISFVLLTLVLVTASSMTAHATGCSNATLRGTFSFTVHGQILPPDGSPALVVDGVAKTTFDGNGNLRQVDAVAINGGVAPGWRPGTGSYSVNADCTGTMTLVNEGMPPLHLQIVVAQSGETIHTVVIDPGFAVTSDAERVVLPRLNH
jgi:hypothetical protein